MSDDETKSDVDTFTPIEDSQLTPTDVGIGALDIPKHDSLTFHFDTTSEEIGTLSYNNGVFAFDGDANESAEIFLDCIRKLHDTKMYKYEEALKQIASQNLEDFQYKTIADIALNTK